MSSDKSWLSAHLFYNEPWEDFLRQAVAPYIQTVLDTGIAESYFFIRYWERGPHIRLRFKGEPKVLEEVLKPNLEEHFSTYFSVNPSEREEPRYPDGFPESFHWLPNNTVHFEKYIPENDRYGGKAALEISEIQFRLSSTSVLDYLSNQEEKHDYQDVLGIAIRMHLSFVFSIGMDIKETIAFFNIIFENWLPRSFEIFENNTPDEQIIIKMKEMVALFTKSFESQKEGLIAFHKSFLDDLKSGEPFESKSFNNWIKGNQQLSLQLQALAESKGLSPRNDSYILAKELEEQLSEEEQVLWNIYADYVHMTNNRLGILNQDEAYLGFLMMKSLSSSQA